MEQIFTFENIPQNLTELKALPEANLDSPFKTAALTLLVLMGYKDNQPAVFEMLEFLNGPDTLSTYTKQFLKDRLAGKEYKPASFFEGASTENQYTPSKPYKIGISDNPHSYTEDSYATVYVKSAGADALRPIRLRKKPSTGEWFVNEIQCLSDIRTPAAADPWA